jgi:hypothetical protein
MSTSKSAEIFAGTYDPPEHLWVAVHFSPSPSSRAVGLAFLKRKLLRQDRDPEVSEEAAAAQREAIGKYCAPAESVLAYLENTHQPTLIAQGSSDVIIPTMNSYILQQNLPNAQLIVYPDSNHGSFYQYPELFVSEADQFLASALQDGDANLRPSERLPFPSIVSATGILAGSAKAKTSAGFNIQSRETHARALRKNGSRHRHLARHWARQRIGARQGRRPSARPLRTPREGSGSRRRSNPQGRRPRRCYRG